MHKRRRPRGGGHEWLGGSLTLPAFVTDREEPYRPTLVVWMDASDGLVVGQGVVPPEEAEAAVGRVLREAIERPLAGPPRRPARVRVASASLAATVQAALGPETPVEVAPTPELDLLLDDLLGSMAEDAGDEDSSYFEDGRVPRETVARLFEAASVLYGLAPWRVAGDHQVLRMDIPALDVMGACVSIIGAAGDSSGVVVFPSLEGYDAFVEAGDDLHGEPARLDLGTSYLALTFEDATALPATMRREAMARGWPVADPGAYPRVERREPDGASRPLVERDVAIATACAVSLAAFFAKHGDVFEAGLSEAICESFTGEDDVEVRFTVPYEAAADFEVGDDAAAGAPGPRPRAGRNDPCPCGSGKKYKRCHLRADEADRRPAGGGAPYRDLDARVASRLTTYARKRFGREWRGFAEDFADAGRTLQLAIPWALFGYRVRGRTVAEAYLAEPGATREERRWLAAQQAAWLSVWEVAEVEPGRGMALCDLLSGEERRVTEISASQTLVARDTILARVVDYEGLSLLCGVHPRPLPPLPAAEVVRRAQRRLRRKTAVPVERLRAELFGRHLIGLWEEAAAEQEARSQVPPELRNTDGERLLLTIDHFDVAPGAQDGIHDRLAAWSDVEAVPAGPADRDEATYLFSAPATRTRRTRETKLVGRLCLSGASLRIETNSRERADALRARLEQACPGLIRHRAREHTSPLSRALAAGPDGAPPEPPPPGWEQVVLEHKQRHYADWTDHPLPALGGRSPREAVRTAEGRRAVDALLKHMENLEVRSAGAGAFDFGSLRKALGIE